MIQGGKNYIFICRNLKRVRVTFNYITIDPNLTFASFRKTSLLYISFRLYKGCIVFYGKKKSRDSLRARSTTWNGPFDIQTRGGAAGKKIRSIIPKR